MVSLIPATTAWIAKTRLAAAPVFVYALVFVMVEMAYIAFEQTAFSQAMDSDVGLRFQRRAKARSYIALTMFGIATIISFWFPQIAFTLVCSVLLIYLSPHLPTVLHRSTR